MSHTLTLDLPDELFTFLEKTAKKTGQLPETIAVQWLNSVTEHIFDDPVEQFIGAIKSPVHDWADSHDQYLGNVIMEEVKGSEYTGDPHE